MSKKGNPGVNKLANVIGKMARDAGTHPLVLDFGIINPDYSLQTNTYPVPIPKGAYSVCRDLTRNPAEPLTKTYCDGSHSHPDAGYSGTHVHNVVLPVSLYWIRPGDKVLVAWVQDEAVVIDIVYNSSIVG